MLFLGLAAGTLVSEDLTSVLAGILIQRGEVSLALGVAACVLGIYVGDLLLYAVGRVVGARALAWRWVRHHLTPAHAARLRTSYNQHIGALILGSRFLPGARLPLYLAAGALRCSVAPFAVWSLIAVAIWTPIVVLASAQSSSFVAPGNEAWSARIAVAAVLLFVWRGVSTLMTTRRLRQRLAASLARVWRWEFWPMWLFYAPVAAWIVWLAIRYRGFAAMSAANPGIPDGGIVGESKHAILERLPAGWTIPSIRLDAGHTDSRIWQFVNALTSRRWTFPLVFKPDVGQRGAGVKIVRSLEDARHYLEREAKAVVVQPFHPGPFEAGVFYYRWPGSSRGRILSITDKHFPAVVGDGCSTIEDLIWADARLRMQARTFGARHAASVTRVLGAGERFQLAMAGNHCQGTMFRDGHHLITTALEARIDSIARSHPGFFIGRFDIRYSDVERFKAGEDLAIVELNGATAESTNIYDPSGSLLDAYRQLFGQWTLVFAIGAANRSAGLPASSVARLVELLRAHLAAKAVFETSD